MKIVLATVVGFAAGVGVGILYSWNPVGVMIAAIIGGILIGLCEWATT